MLYWYENKLGYRWAVTVIWQWFIFTQKLKSIYHFFLHKKMKSIYQNRQKSTEQQYTIWLFAFIWEQKWNR